MPGVSLRNGKYRFWYTDENGRDKWGTGTADKKRTLELAAQLEHQARLVREGLVEPGTRQRQAAAGAKPSVLVTLWREWLVNKGSSAAHARHQAGACQRLLDAAGVKSVAAPDADALAGALAELRGRRSVRTANHALVAVKGFYHWLDDTGRVREFPKGLKRLKRLNEETDRRRVRRELTPDETARLIAAAEGGPDRHVFGHTKSKHQRLAVTGPARAMLYRIALGTGFRAAELRSLTPESFALDADPPAVTITAAYSKSKKTVAQQIAPELAARVRDWLGRGNPLPLVPDRTAEMIAADCKLAGIDPGDPKTGTVDFHALRHTYISRLVRSGASVKTCQTLARHSTPTLTIGRYAHTEADEKRKALGDGE